MSLAAQGLRHLDGKAERIGDPAELAAVRRTARGVQLRSLVAAGIGTALALLVP